MERGPRRAMEFTLRACTSGHTSLDEEKTCIRHLQSSNPTTMCDLEQLYLSASTPITRILLASILEQALNEEFESFSGDLAMYAECDEICQTCDPHRICLEDFTLEEIRSWKDPFNSKQATMIRRFSWILETLRHDYEYPCDIRQYENRGFATWSELSVAATNFMQVRSPDIADCLELIHFLRKRPYLNMTQSTRPLTASAMGKQEADIDAFDTKLERVRRKYPIIDKLADPTLVTIEPVGNEPVIAQLAALLATMADATIYPLPSQIPPVNLADPAGPPGATFRHTFEVANLGEGKTFAAMLRVALAGANQRGGAGPQARIYLASCGAGGFRVY